MIFKLRGKNKQSHKNITSTGYTDVKCIYKKLSGAKSKK